MEEELLNAAAQMSEKLQLTYIEVFLTGSMSQNSICYKCTSSDIYNPDCFYLQNLIYFEISHS